MKTEEGTEAAGKIVCEWCGTYWDCGPPPRCQGAPEVVEMQRALMKEARESADRAQLMGTIKHEVWLLTTKHRTWVQVVPAE